MNESSMYCVYPLVGHDHMKTDREGRLKYDVCYYFDKKLYAHTETQDAD